jgi:hypothetical protein
MKENQKIFLTALYCLIITFATVLNFENLLTKIPLQRKEPKVKFYIFSKEHFKTRLTKAFGGERGEN